MKQSDASLRTALTGYLFIGPGLVGFLVFTLIPVIASFVVSLMSWDLLSPPQWVGLQNYIALLHDRVFWICVINTLKWVVYYVPASIIVSLVLALAMNLPLRGISVFRTIFYLPVISPLIAVALLFVWLYNPDFGLINYLLSFFHVPPLQWLNSETLALPAIAVMSVWKSAGWNMVIYLAALQGIPRSLYEAASIDGATAWQRFWRITLPLLSPATFFIVVMALIGAFQVFGEVYVMTQGGPGYSTHTLAYYLWTNGFKDYKMGYASAIAYVLFGFIFATTFIQNRVFGKKVNYDL